MAELLLIDTPLDPGPAQTAGGDLPAEDEALDAYSRVITGVARRLGPSVAHLRVTRRVNGHHQNGSGSGVVITPDGFIVTSAHVVDGATGRVSAAFADGREVSARVVGADPPV